jgi:hypothetical protein
MLRERRFKEMPEIDTVAVYKSLCDKGSAGIVSEIKEYIDKTLIAIEFNYSQECNGMRSAYRKILKIIDKEKE